MSNAPSPAITTPRLVPVVWLHPDLPAEHFAALGPIDDGETCVEADDLSAEQVALIMQTQAARAQAEESQAEGYDPSHEPFLGDIEGGFVLLDGDNAEGDPLVLPGCCTDLSDLAGWRHAAESESEEWETLWNGHPWPDIRRNGDWLELREPHEGTPDENAWVRALTPGDLKAAVAEASESLHRLAAKMLPVAEVWAAAHGPDRADPRPPAAIVDDLLGLL